MGHLVGNLNLLLMSLILTVTLLSLRNVLTGILSGDYNPLEWRQGKSKNIRFLRLQTPFSICCLRKTTIIRNQVVAQNRGKQGNYTGKEVN